MAVPSVITDLNVTAASNSPAGSEAIGTALDDYLRGIQAIVRREQAQGAALASASTVNIGSTTDGNYVHITGTTTITGFGTVAAGISRTVVFDGALTLTHNATSLILPTGANITTAAGDVAEFVSEGSGNWRCIGYVKANGGAPNYTTGTFTATLTGCTTSPTVTVRWVKSGSVVTLSMAASVAATSNATSKTLTGMPASLYPSTNIKGFASISDNTGANVVGLFLLSTSGVWNFYANANAGNWTASGTATIGETSVSYVI